MASVPTLIAKKRDVTTKGHLRAMKREDWVPGIVYGKGESLPIILPGKDLQKAFSVYGSRGVFSLQIEGEATPIMALVRDVQKAAIKGNLQHVDFMKVQADEKIKSQIPVQFTGEDEVIKKGLVMQTLAREVEIECLASNIPEAFTYDLSTLEAGDKVTAADLILPDGVALLSDQETVLATILAPSRAAEEETEEEKEEETTENPA